jgi:hypothetical protein
MLVHAQYGCSAQICTGSPLNVDSKALSATHISLSASYHRCPRYQLLNERDETRLDSTPVKALVTRTHAVSLAAQAGSISPAH